jgi:hypothetical protein
VRQAFRIQSSVKHRNANFKSIGLESFSVPKTPRSYRPGSQVDTAVTLIENVLEWRRGVGQGKNITQLEDVINQTIGNKCSKQEDRIYAVLSLAPLENGELLLRAEYQPQVNLKEINRRLAAHSIQRYRSLNILRYVQHPREGISIPSWVPQWFTAREQIDTNRVHPFEPLEREPKFITTPGTKDCELPDQLIVSGSIMSKLGWLSQHALVTSLFRPNDRILRASDQSSLDQYIDSNVKKMAVICSSSQSVTALCPECYKKFVAYIFAEAIVPLESLDLNLAGDIACNHSREEVGFTDRSDADGWQMGCGPDKT